MKIVHYKEVPPILMNTDPVKHVAGRVMLGKVFIGETWHELKPDTAIFVPPNVEHQFRNNSDEVFSFLCLVPSVAPEM